MALIAYAMRFVYNKTSEILVLMEGFESMQEGVAFG